MRTYSRRSIKADGEFCQKLKNTSGVELSDDQCYLLYFIMGTYFGPDLVRDKPHKSALQRHSEGLLKYHVNDLAASQMQTSVMESVYYYILRKADQSVVVKRQLLLQYIHGKPPVSVTYPPFDDLFPPNLHWRSRFGNQQDAIGNIVFLNCPATDFIKLQDIERFKRLTGLDDFLLDRGEALQYIHRDHGTLHDVNMQENSRLADPVQHVNVTEARPKRNGISNCTMPCSSSLGNAEPITFSTTQTSQMTTDSVDDLDHGMIYLPSCPSKEGWSNLIDTIEGGYALTGSAARGNAGPVLGLIDIGESDDSYLFRVALPGVKRDERDFSCEVESNGTVIIRGVTVTGEKTVCKYSQAFEMQSQNLCPPGPFSISFMLPGPVDPQQFHGTFASDGILEGIAVKANRYTN